MECNTTRSENIEHLSFFLSLLMFFFIAFSLRNIEECSFDFCSIAKTFCTMEIEKIPK